MSNHIHLVVVQGARPLADFMQPLLRRIALRVHATHGRCLETGHATNRIARFLRVSDTIVSRVATAMRSVPANPAATVFR